MAEGVEYSDELIKALERSLQSAFNPKMSLNRRRSGRVDPFRISLALGDKESPDDYDQQWVMQILTAGKPSGFYFGFSVRFAIRKLEPKHTVEHSSLAVFYDVCGELVPLFRAEWDLIAASDGTSMHAQPHWHFVQSPERIESIIYTWQGRKGEFGGEEQSGLFADLADCGRFHFAMVSLSDKNLPAHKHIFQSEDFVTWFDKLAHYIAGQIAYVFKHLAAPKEFNPANE
jgi:hypothetical protein